MSESPKSELQATVEDSIMFATLISAIVSVVVVLSNFEQSDKILYFTNTAPINGLLAIASAAKIKSMVDKSKQKKYPIEIEQSDIVRPEYIEDIELLNSKYDAKVESLVQNLDKGNITTLVCVEGKKHHIYKLFRNESGEYGLYKLLYNNSTVTPNYTFEKIIPYQNTDSSMDDMIALISNGDVAFISFVSNQDKIS